MHSFSSGGSFQSSWWGRSHRSLEVDCLFFPLFNLPKSAVQISSTIEDGKWTGWPLGRPPQAVLTLGCALCRRLSSSNFSKVLTSQCQLWKWCVCFDSWAFLTIIFWSITFIIKSILKLSTPTHLMIDVIILILQHLYELKHPYWSSYKDKQLIISH